MQTISNIRLKLTEKFKSQVDISFFILQLNKECWYSGFYLPMPCITQQVSIMFK